MSHRIYFSDYVSLFDQKFDTFKMQRKSNIREHELYHSNDILLKLVLLLLKVRKFQNDVFEFSFSFSCHISNDFQINLPCFFEFSFIKELVKEVYDTNI
jgi:hypothetical protein